MIENKTKHLGTKIVFNIFELCFLKYIYHTPKNILILNDYHSLFFTVEFLHFQINETK